MKRWLAGLALFGLLYAATMAQTANVIAALLP